MREVVPLSGSIDPSVAQIVASVLVLIGVVVTAVLGYLGVKAQRRTQEHNQVDHGRVISALNSLRGSVDQLSGDVREVTKAHAHHLQWHLDKKETDNE